HDPTPPNIFTLSLHDALPIYTKSVNAAYNKAVNDQRMSQSIIDTTAQQIALDVRNALTQVGVYRSRIDTAKTVREIAQKVLDARSEEHTSELQSRSDLVCRLL